MSPATPLAWKRYLLLGMAAGILAAACGDATTPVPSTTLAATSTSEPTAASTSISPPILTGTNVPIQRDFVRVDNTVFPVELAVTAEERIKGLSGRAFLDSGTGMLFVFETESRFRFWMREMQFPLDMVWIGAGCKVVDISLNVPPPDPGIPTEELPRYSPSGVALYVLEINGGESSRLGLGPGDPVRFVGALAGKYRC